jgi:hypothetical protein
MWHAVDEGLTKPVAVIRATARLTGMPHELALGYYQILPNLLCAFLFLHWKIWSRPVQRTVAWLPVSGHLSPPKRRGLPHIGPLPRHWFGMLPPAAEVSHRGHGNASGALPRCVEQPDTCWTPQARGPPRRCDNLHVLICTGLGAGPGGGLRQLTQRLHPRPGLREGNWLSTTDGPALSVGSMFRPIWAAVNPLLSSGQQAANASSTDRHLERQKVNTLRSSSLSLPCGWGHHPWILGSGPIPVAVNPMRLNPMRLDVSRRHPHAGGFIEQGCSPPGTRNHQIVVESWESQKGHHGAGCDLD